MNGFHTGRLRPRDREACRQPTVRLASALAIAAAVVATAPSPSPAQPSPTPAPSAAPAAGAAAAPDGAADRWYVARVAHDHDAHGGHGGGHGTAASGTAAAGAHAHHAPAARVWEPEQEIDPATVRGYQEMYETTRYPHTDRPTPEQQRRADDLVRRSREAVRRHGWQDYDKAKRDGFKLIYGDTMHHVNEEFVLDDRTLDPDHPEFLLFYDTPAGKRLAALMFLMRDEKQRGPQIGGPLTVWHYHVWSKGMCVLRKAYNVGDPDAEGRCAQGELFHRSPEMMHVWLIDHPQGPFATDMTLSPEMAKQLVEAKNQ